VLPGTYNLQITGTDMSGTKVHSVPVNVTIASILTRINVAPNVAIAQTGTTRRFTATALRTYVKSQAFSEAENVPITVA